MTQPDTLHTRLRAEIDRLLMAAHGADDGNGTWPQAEDLDRGMTYATRRFIELFSPLAIIAWLEAELEVLERHAPGYPGGEVDYGTHTERTESGQYVEVRDAEPIPACYCERCDDFQPCPEIRSLAHRLGVSVDG